MPALIPLQVNGGRERLFNLTDRRARYDDLVARARALTSAEFLKFPNRVTELPKDDYSEEPSLRGDTAAKAAKADKADTAVAAARPRKPLTTTTELESLSKRLGIGAQILRLTTLLNKAVTDDVSRLLLATPGVFESALLRHAKEANNNPDALKDVEGMRQSVMFTLGGVPRESFLRALIDEFLRTRKLGVKSGDPLYEALYEAVSRAALPVTPGRVGPYLQRIFDTVKKEGGLPAFVDAFATQRQEIDPMRFTPIVRESMVRYLETIGLDTERANFTSDFQAGRLDEYFAQAYHSALFADGGNGDGSGDFPAPTALDSDFSLDTFEFTEEQGVVKENVLAASALAYFQILGDTLGIFPIVNALILRRARGRLDLPRGPGAERVQRYKRFLRNAPVTTEDRQLLYRRVFDEGEGEMLPDTVVNEEYPVLFHTLMETVRDYIAKDEANASERGDKISRGPIDEAVRNLQSNLSYFANDIAEDVLVIKEQFNLAFGILSDDDVIASCGVSRRGNPWSLIERLSQEELHSGRTVLTLRKLGVETYRVLQYVANFDVTTPEESFREFLRSAEAVIMARAKVGDLPDSKKNGDEEEEDDWEAENEDEDDDGEPAGKGEDDWSE